MNSVELLRHEIETFEACRASLGAEAVDKYALVHGDDVVGLFTSEREAIVEGRTQFGYVPILVERVTADGKPNAPQVTVTMLDFGQDPSAGTIHWVQPGGALHHFGPVARVSIGVTEIVSEGIERSGGLVPSPVSGNALIDTGASFSALDENVVSALGLQPVGRLDVAGHSETITSLRYDTVLMMDDRIPLEVLVTENRLRRSEGIPVPSYDALIGRDILVGAILTYDGISGRVSLQFGGSGQM